MLTRIQRLTKFASHLLPGRLQLQYEAILEQLANIRFQKVISYGLDRYKDEDIGHSMTILYSDIYRKYIRVKNLTLTGQIAETLEEGDGESLRQALMDLANYAVMGVQLLDIEADRNGKQDEELRSAADALVLERDKENAGQRPGLKIDQIAVYSPRPDLLGLLNRVFDLKEEDWSKDKVVATGKVFERINRNQADLSFHYGLAPGVEFELLRYEAGESWHYARDEEVDRGNPFISHFGVHVTEEQMAIAKERLTAAPFDFKIAQEVVTVSHTNPKIKDSRRYHYVIFDTRPILGFDLKLIERLPYKPVSEGCDEDPA